MENDSRGETEIAVIVKRKMLMNALKPFFSEPFLKSFYGKRIKSN